MNKVLSRSRIQWALMIGSALAISNDASAVDLKLGDTPVAIHGFASQGYLKSTDYNYLGETVDGSAEFTEAGLNFSVSPLPRTRIAAQVFTFDVGEVNNFDVLLDFASLEYTFNDHFGIRAGRIRRPGGIYGHIVDVDLARTYVLLPQGIYDARWRDFSTSIDGGEFFGNIPLGKAGGLSYETYAGVMHLSDQGGVALQIRDTLPPKPIGRLNGIDDCVIVGGQFWWNTPINGLRAGVSSGIIDDFTFTSTIAPPFGPGEMKSVGDIPFVTTSLEYVWNKWTFQSEYMTYRSENTVTAGGMTVSKTVSDPDTWYVSAARRLTDWCETGVYYTEYYADSGNRSGANNYQKDAALALRFDPASWCIFKLEGHYLHGTALLQDNAHNPSRDDNGWWMLAAKATFYF